ncbi:MAG: ankyrin repeat domain-containing protein, partial [Candidatus Saccharimonadales bacterium]
RLAQVLGEHGADVQIWNRKNDCGWTPLMVAQGHRPGNFRPSPSTIAALEKLIRNQGVDGRANKTNKDINRFGHR